MVWGKFFPNICLLPLSAFEWCIEVSTDQHVSLKSADVGVEMGEDFLVVVESHWEEHLLYIKTNLFLYM